MRRCWDLRHSIQQTYQTNRQTLIELARVLEQHPAVYLVIHCETDEIEEAPEHLARHFNLDKKYDVVDVMEHLAWERATACLEELVQNGVRRERLGRTTRPRKGSKLSHGNVEFRLQKDPPPSERETRPGIYSKNVAGSLSSSARTYEESVEKGFSENG